MGGFAGKNQDMKGWCRLEGFGLNAPMADSVKGAYKA